MASRGSAMKELYKLIRNADRLFDGQVEILYNDGDEAAEDEITSKELDIKFLIAITPNDGLYKGARVTFQVKLDSESYPDRAPEVNCLNHIYHPNINYPSQERMGDICVSLLGEDWQPEVGLDGCVMAVLFLFYNPQIDDCLSPVCNDLDDWEQFANNVLKSLRGEEVEGFPFDILVSIDDNNDTVLLEPAGVVNDENDKVSEAAIVVDDENKEALKLSNDGIDENRETSNEIVDEKRPDAFVAIDTDNLSDDFKKSSLKVLNNCSFLKAWYMKLKERFSLFRSQKMFTS